MIEGGTEERLQGQGGHCLVQAKAGEARPGQVRPRGRGEGLVRLCRLRPSNLSFLIYKMGEWCAVGWFGLYYCPLKEVG